MGMRLILFSLHGTKTIWLNFPFYVLQGLMGGENNKSMPNRKTIAIRTLCKPVSKGFAPTIRAEIMGFFKVWP